MKYEKTFISSKYYAMLAGGTLTSLLVAAVVMADTFIAGLLLGDRGVAGVNLVLPVYSLAGFFALAISLGAPILYSHQAGAFQKEKADKTFGTGLLLAIITGLALFIILLLFGNEYLHFYDADQDIYELAKAYLKWMKYYIMLTPLQALISGMVFTDGDEVVSSIGNLISGVGNILLSIPLCLKMGIGGLGMASFMTSALALIFLFSHFLKKSNSLRLNLFFSLEIMHRIIKYSIVDSSTYLFIAIFTFTCNHLVVYFFGSEMLYLAAVVTFMKEMQIIFDGIGEAITPLISLYLGEETYGGVHEIWRHAKRTARIEGVLVTCMAFVLAPLFIRVIGVTDPQAAHIATWELRIISLSLIFTCRLYLDSSYYIIVDKIPLGVLICALRDIVISLPLAVVGINLGGIYGMAFGLMLAQPLSYMISVYYVKLRYGKDNYPLFIANKEDKKRTLFYEFEINEANIVSVRDAIGNVLEQEKYTRKTVNRVMLLIEEALMMIFDNNQGKKVLAECSMIMGDPLTVIIKDDGILFDLTKSDMEVNSMRSYVMANLINNYSLKKMHFLTLSYNRNVFEIKEESVK